MKSDFNEKIKEIKKSHLPDDWTILKLSYKGLIGKPISETIMKPDPIKRKGKCRYMVLSSKYQKYSDSS